MKRLLSVFITAVFLLLAISAQAVTVYYQPTPYPLKKIDGSAMPQNLNIIHSHTGYVRSSLPSTNFFHDGGLMAGGWGDVYRMYFNWDLTGLPSVPDNVTLWLRSYPPVSPATQTGFQICIPNTPWDTTLTWNLQPGLVGCTASTSPITFPTTDSWKSVNVLGWYINWQNGTWTKNGMMISPLYVNNNFDYVRSSRYADFANDPQADGKRPILQFDFVPSLDLKMPLPGGYAWLLTNESGGYECTGGAPWPDTAHQGVNYFSLDVTYSGSGYPTSVPVLAAAGGKVIIKSNSGDSYPNGNYVIIDHDGYGDESTGFQTWYLHLADVPRRKNGTALQTGDTINQGDQIGFMGSTGHLNGVPTSTGVHLHFGVRYQNSGASTVPEMTKVIMEGSLLKSYQTECSINGSGVPISWIRRYSSSMIPTGK